MGWELIFRCPERAWCHRFRCREKGLWIFFSFLAAGPYAALLLMRLPGIISSGHDVLNDVTVWWWKMIMMRWSLRPISRWISLMNIEQSLCQRHGWFGAWPAAMLVIWRWKLDVKIPWLDMRDLCTYKMDITSLAITFTETTTTTKNT